MTQGKLDLTTKRGPMPSSISVKRLLAKKRGGSIF
jgi:hypothetical protein